MKVIPLLIAAALGLSLQACGPKRHSFDPSLSQKWSGKEDKSVLAQVIWAKNKYDTIDVKLQLTNKTSDIITVQNGSFQMVFNGQVLASPSNDTSIIPPNSMKMYTLIFQAHPQLPEVGVAKLSISNLKTEEKGTKIAPIEINLPMEGH